MSCSCCDVSNDECKAETSQCYYSVIDLHMSLDNVDRANYSGILTYEFNLFCDRAHNSICSCAKSVFPIEMNRITFHLYQLQETSQLFLLYVFNTVNC